MYSCRVYIIGLLLHHPVYPGEAFSHDGHCTRHRHAQHHTTTNSPYSEQHSIHYNDPVYIIENYD